MLTFFVVLAILAVAGGVILAFVWVGLLGKSEKEAEATAPEKLDEIFNGEPVVTYGITYGTMKFDTLVKGAIERGYDLRSQSGGGGSYGTQQLVFVKND